jgi:AcrR family transcriptional regulator
MLTASNADDAGGVRSCQNGGWSRFGAQIREAAYRLMARNGFYGTTLRDVAAAAEVAKEQSIIIMTASCRC